MGVSQQRVHEIVDDAVSHRWGVPEFQRGFVWKSTQVRDLARSLYLRFPIGTLLLWTTGNGQEPRAVVDGTTPASWLVDGQQRTSALAILFRRKPYWWNPVDPEQEWNRIVERYDVRFDVEADEDPYFVVANAVVRNRKDDRYVPLHRLLCLDDKRDDDRRELERLAEQIKERGLCPRMSTMEVYSRLERVRRIRDVDIVTLHVDHELEDVVQIFELMNSRGTRVTEADIYLGIVSARPENRGWVREEFLPFLGTLVEYGYHVDPNLLFRSLTALGAKRVRFRDIPRDFWSGERIRPAWKRCTDAWRLLVQRLEPYGVLSDGPLPTKTALVTLLALVDKFGQESNFDPAFFWYLQAARFGRYSGSATTATDQDLSDVHSSATLEEAVVKLCRRMPQLLQPFSPEDFRRDYSDGAFHRFLMYVLAFRNEAQDWDERGMKLGFEGNQLAKDFNPQWHHIFPVKYLEDCCSDSETNQLANIAVIGPAMNIRISAKSPMRYLTEYRITDAKLRQQLIEPEDGLRAQEAASDKKLKDRSVLERFVEQRAARLADAANQLLENLGTSIWSDLGMTDEGKRLLLYALPYVSDPGFGTEPDAQALSKKLAQFAAANPEHPAAELAARAASYVEDMDGTYGSDEEADRIAAEIERITGTATAMQGPWSVAGDSSESDRRETGRKTDTCPFCGKRKRDLAGHIQRRHAAEETGAPG